LAFSIVEELMPPVASEFQHSHLRSRQVFYVLDGELTMEVEGHTLFFELAKELRSSRVFRIKC
jgi:mannose-6-phosphate isomerase-like protein (cupin superfamily)